LLKVFRSSPTLNPHLTCEDSDQKKDLEIKITEDEGPRPPQRTRTRSDGQ